MNKADLAKIIANKAQLSQSKAWEALDAAFDAIQATLQQGQKVNLVGFGSFKVKDRKARTGRNPKTGEEIFIKARRVPSFSAGTDLRKALQEAQLSS